MGKMDKGKGLVEPKKKEDSRSKIGIESPQHVSEHSVVIGEMFEEKRTTIF